MKDYMKEMKEAKMKSAIESAMARYRAIEDRFAFLENLDEMVGDELDMSAVLNEFSVYSYDTGYQLYGYGTYGNRKELLSEMLIAFTDAFGDGVRDINGSTNITYTWENAVNGQTLQIECGAEMTGCKLVEKTVEVPAQPATTKTVYEIECDKEAEASE